MFQFSLRNLLVAVSAVAVGTAALLNANSWWSSLLWGAALSMLGFAGFVAYCRREAQRAFWSGYVVAGSLYLLLLMYSVPNHSQSNTWMPYGPLNHDNLVTTKVTTWAYTLLPASKTTPWLPAPPAPGGASGGMPGMAASGMMPGGGMPGMPPAMRPQPISNPNYIDLEAFDQVGHSLWMFFLSWLGGTVMYWLYRTRSTSERSVAT